MDRVFREEGGRPWVVKRAVRVGRVRSKLRGRMRLAMYASKLVSTPENVPLSPSVADEPMRRRPLRPKEVAKSRWRAA